MLSRGPLRAMVILCIATLVAACNTDQWDKLHCQFGGNGRVSSNRVITLLAANYVYVSAQDDEASRRDYENRARNLISEAYDAVNKIFREDHTNIQIVSLPTVQSLINEKLNVFDNAGLGGSGPDQNDINEMMRVHQVHGVIGVHWPEWLVGKGFGGVKGFGPSPTCSSEISCNWVIMSGFLRNPPTLLGEDLAHEFGHYFSLDHVGDPANLMCGDNCSRTGFKLESWQLNMMWNAINAGWRTSLLSTTCDPPITPAPRLPKTS
jgi:hypothetical protein